jgi:hypothetical protein
MSEEGHRNKEKKPKQTEWKSDRPVMVTLQKNEHGWTSNKDIQMEVQETFQKKSKEEGK